MRNRFGPEHSHRPAAHRAAAHGRRPAFTLIELLAVIAIIALLAGILVPAVSQVRLTAKKTSTASDIATLTTGIQTSKADQRLGGSFPPSASDWANSNGSLLRNVRSPYVNQGIAGDFRIEGAGLLVWALAGADLLGSPGFRTVRNGSTFWAEDTLEGTSAAPGAYFIDTTGSNAGQARFARSGPFVDLSKVRISKFVKSGSPSGQPSFDIPAELEARAALGIAAYQRKYPMFLDSFGFPLLYWRADPAGQRMADESPGGPQLPADRGKYHYDDNSYLVKGLPYGGSGLLVLQASSSKNPFSLHSLEFQRKGLVGGAKPLWPERTFQRYIENKNVMVRSEPSNPDSYLLISAGPDGLYGTADDITNFEHGGQY